MQNDFNLKFEQEYIKNAPIWAIERDPDGSYKYHATASAFKLYEKLQAKINQLEQQLLDIKLDNHCMIGQFWFMKGTPVANLIKHAEDVYKAEAIAQNSKIEFGTDDNEHWFAHDVPFFGRVQISFFKDDQEWDIILNDCWQGPFDSKSQCIQHLEECIQEKREEQGLEGTDHA